MTQKVYRYSVESFVSASLKSVETGEKTMFGTTAYLPAGTVLWRAIETEVLSFRRRAQGEVPDQHVKLFSTQALAEEQAARWVAERAKEALAEHNAASHVSEGWDADIDTAELLRIARRALLPEKKHAA